MSKYNTELSIHGVTKITHRRVHWLTGVPSSYWVHRFFIEDSSGNEFQVTLYAIGDGDVEFVQPPTKEE